MPELQILVSEVDGHFDALMTRKEVELAGFCQAIVYELLYACVFGLRTDEVWRGRDALHLKLRGSNGARDHTGSARDTELIPFAYRAAKALDETVYRNVQFDNWRDEAIQSGLVKQLAFNAILDFGSDVDNFAQLRMEHEIPETIGNDVPANWMIDSGPGAFQTHLELTNTTQFDERCLPERHYMSEALVSADTVLQANRFPFHFVPSMPPSDAFTITASQLASQSSVLPLPHPDTAWSLIQLSNFDQILKLFG
ncbi:OTU domain-containing protein 4 [Clonorchis sinensis]|uniref:OTU domain-containing protein 4 n=1 Tax=Clonorchis sinensis TaxID=79923 RepID=G7Y767_CLOSI|nr:OTU domain-containing protein 4 [Clonorchis sinensis]